MREPVVTIDGPAGAGKSTVARCLAKRLGYRYLETGAMYRALAWALREKGVRSEDEPELPALAESVTVDVEADGRVRVNGKDVTDQIRQPGMDQWSSRLSQVSAVRAVLTRLQRAMAQTGRVVLEGRDTGSVVMPDAEVKFYLDATLEERARRRLRDLASLVGATASLGEMMRELEERDSADRSRAIAPLVKPEDAHEIDSTTMTIEDVVEFMGKEVERIRCSIRS
ncbi:MAG TPA: (d)CMP kinase [Methylomirabilota bacterium]|nr:(d)CMP kinase [Methylomirabilota bacterium]